MELENEEAVRHVAGGYIQVMFACYEDRDPAEYVALADSLVDVLFPMAQDYNWHLRSVLKFVVFKLDKSDELIPWLWIWFYAAARTPEEGGRSREMFIVALHNALSDETLRPDFAS